MSAQGETLGVLHLRDVAPAPGGSGETGDGLPESRKGLALSVAERIGLALANLKLRETLRTQSIRDPLTGLFNRRYLEESLEQELRRAVRHQRRLGLIMLDLDYFKRFNDTFGHDAGDALLSRFGALLQRQSRAEDTACRYGGEEFLLILPEASLEVTRQRAEQVREAVKQLQVEHRQRALGAITVSLGVAAYPEHGATAEALVQAADAALYRAKAEGRDRVVLSASGEQSAAIVLRPALPNP
jgi:diguanylate cyclase (GGDEF)-like protein